MLIWPFDRKRRKSRETELEPADPRPPGAGWRRWFELSARAAAERPWDYEMVQIWRPEWAEPRTTRSADVPHQLDGPGFWWRPVENRTMDAAIAGNNTLLIDNPPSPPARDTK